MITTIPFYILPPPTVAGVGVKTNTQDRKKQEKKKEETEEEIFEKMLETEIIKIDGKA